VKNVKPDPGPVRAGLGVGRLELNGRVYMPADTEPQDDVDMR
jgi:hypothetical protein